MTTMIQDPSIVRQDDAVLQNQQRASRQVKKEIIHPDFPPPRYFDDLSKKHLTRFALWELDRRNYEFRRPSSWGQEHIRPRTRLTIARWRDSNPSAEHLIERCSLDTLGQIRRYSMHGGPDLTDLRGFWAPDSHFDSVMSLKSSLGRRKRPSVNPLDIPNTETTKPTKRTKNTGPYDPNFRQHLMDNGIAPTSFTLLDGQTLPKPENFQEIMEALSKPRAALDQFSEEDYSRFVRDVDTAANERQVMMSVISCLEGKSSDRGCAGEGVIFKNLDHLTDETLVAATPDQYHGARPSQLHNTIRDTLDNYIIPSTKKDLPIVPNFFLEAKGPEGHRDVAILQACYNGALGARGIHNLRSYGSPASTIYDNKAYVITAIYISGMLDIYTTHPIQQGTQTVMVMTRLRAFALQGGLETFREGATAYQNVVDWAKKQRDLAIKEANKRLRKRASAQSVTGSSPADHGQHKDMIERLGRLALVSPLESRADSDDEAFDLQHPPKRRQLAKPSQTTDESSLFSIPELDEHQLEADS